MTLKCDVCGRSYKSKSGLSRHKKAKHPAAQESTARTVEPVATPAALPTVVIIPADRRLVEGACKALGIDLENVMSYAIREGRVVIIEGPVGYKREWFSRGGSK